MKHTLLALVFGASTFIASAQSKDNPKLVVGIVVDQMCYDYLYRYESKFSKDGFKRLMTKGANFRNAHYNYVPTYTGPGHASIYTGTTPSNHGIVANDWYVRDQKQMTNCVADPTVHPVGTASKVALKSPVNLEVLTVTDHLKMNSAFSKVISISFKDRGAILPGGHLSDGTYWFDEEAGEFITSSFYKQGLPSWVNEFNHSGRYSSYFDQSWKTLLPIESYTESLPDNSPYEVIFPTKTAPVFPYDMKTEIGKERFIYTPYANTHLAEFAMSALRGEELGKDQHADFLCISFSSTDYLGHAFGPYSVEIEDMYLRLDLEIAKLMKELDRQVGSDQYVLFLTADHAVVPVPQMLVDKKLPGGYFYTDSLTNAFKSTFKSQYGNELIQKVVNQNIYLDNEYMLANKINRDEVVAHLKSQLLSIKEVKKAYTSDDLLNQNSQERDLDMVSKGYFKEKSGDVIFVLQSGYLSKSKPATEGEKGTSHGNLFNYDTHVPLLIYGKNIAKREVFRRIEIIDIAPSIAQILHLSHPSGSTGVVINELFVK